MSKNPSFMMSALALALIAAQPLSAKADEASDYEANYRAEVKAQAAAEAKVQAEYEARARVDAEEAAKAQALVDAKAKAEKQAEQASNAPRFAKASIGLGAETTSNSHGSAGGLQTRFTGRHIARGEDKDNPFEGPTHAHEIDVTYNMIGTTDKGKLTTGLTGRARAFVGGSFLDKNERSCDIYGGVGGQIDVSAYLNRPGQNTFVGNIGPETGLMCQLGPVMLQVSPSVGIGRAAAAEYGMIDPNDPEKKLNGPDTNNNWIQMGGRARVLVNNRFYVSADGFATPKKSGDGTEWTAKYGSVNAQVLAGKWAFTGYAKGLMLLDTTGVQAPIKAGEAGLSAGRAF
jgi:hypothetical protein